MDGVNQARKRMKFFMFLDMPQEQRLAQVATLAQASTAATLGREPRAAQGWALSSSFLPEGIQIPWKGFSP